MKALKITISGSYKTEGKSKERVDFMDMERIIPYVPEEFAAQQVRARYARMWLILDPKYKKRPSIGRPSVYIDKSEVIENHDFGFEGKDIRAMDVEELQDLACAFSLRRIPLFQEADLRRMRTIAYAEYNNEVLSNGKLDYNESGFNIMDYDPIIVKSAAVEVKKNPIEALIPKEDGTLPDGSAVPKRGSVSIDELKEVAKELGVKFNPKVPYDVLYDKVYRQAS
jgi:hypothetical protein